MYNRLHTVPTCDGQTSCHGLHSSCSKKLGVLPLLRLIIDYVTNAPHPVS